MSKEMPEMNLEVRRMMDPLRKTRKAFAQFDLDGSGKLSAEEFKAVLSRGNGMSEDEVLEILKLFDRNKDGEIDIDGTSLALHEPHEASLVKPVLTSAGSTPPWQSFVKR